MKPIKYLLATLLLLSSSLTNSLSAQDLSKLSVADRNKKLVEIATEIYKTPSIKAFYREYGTPKITEFKTKNLSTEKRYEISSNRNNIWYGSSNNQKYYIVHFFYDPKKDSFDQEYTAGVYIWENTGKPFAIELGNMFIFRVVDGKIIGAD